MTKIVQEAVSPKASRESVVSSFPMDWLQERIQDTVRAYLVLDGAAPGDILRTLYELEDNPAYIPLFAGTQYHKLSNSGPLLIPVTPNSPVLSWFTNESAASAGILIGTTVEESALEKHLQEHLTIHMPSNEEGLFRFYDPVVFFDWLSISNHQYAKGLTQAFDWYAVNAYSTDNINYWYLGTANEPTSVDNLLKKQAMPPDALEILENIRERRLINAHIEALKVAQEIEPSLVGKCFESIPDPYFTLVRVGSGKAYVISDDEYADVYARLEGYETRYGVPVFDDLLRLDHMLSPNDASAQSRIDSILHNRTFPFSRRLELCSEYLEDEHVST